MTAIDSNVLIRLLTRDDPEQYRQAREFLQENAPVWVTHISLIETVWVLSRSYKQGKEQIVALLEMMLCHHDFHLQEPGVVEGALRSWKGAKADFADCLILQTVKKEGQEPLASFDRDLAALDDVHLITATRE